MINSSQLKKYAELIEKAPDLEGVNLCCNICGFSFAKFLPFGLKQRQNAQCPMCSSLERHRHLYIHLLPLLLTAPNAKLLHFAPEKILKSVITNTTIKYFDADITPGRATLVEDMTNISFDSNFFDYCLAIHILEHIVDDVKAMKELFRVLRPGGKAILIVPVREKSFEDYTITDPNDRETHFGQSDHVRYYSLNLFTERLHSVGFSTTVIGKKHFPINIWERHKLGDFIVVASKPEITPTCFSKNTSLFSKFKKKLR